MQQKMHHFGGRELWQCGFFSVYDSEIAAQLKHSEGERDCRER